MEYLVITEKDIIMDNIFKALPINDYLNDLEDDLVKKNEVVHSMMKDFDLSRDQAGELLEMYYMSNQDLEPTWK